MTGRAAIPGIEMRLKADPCATLRKTLSDCLFIAQRLNLIVLVMVSFVDMAITPASDVSQLHQIYSREILDKAKSRNMTRQLRRRLTRVLKIAA